MPKSRKGKGESDLQVSCNICHAVYANRRNRRRLMNSVHNQNVRYFSCPEGECDRIFTRREGLQMHLERTHEEDCFVAKQKSRGAALCFPERGDIESVGYELSLKLKDKRNNNIKVQLGKSGDGREDVCIFVEGTGEKGGHRTPLQH